jgi:hypothetical protein
MKTILLPHPEVAAQRPSKGLLQHSRFILMDASRPGFAGHLSMRILQEAMST